MYKRYLPHIERQFLNKKYMEKYQHYGFPIPMVCQVTKIALNATETHIYVHFVANYDRIYYRRILDDIMALFHSYFNIPYSRLTFTFEEASFEAISGYEWKI